MKFFTTCVLWIATLIVILVATEKFNANLGEVKEDTLAAFENALATIQAELQTLKSEAPALAEESSKGVVDGVILGGSPLNVAEQALGQAKELAEKRASEAAKVLKKIPSPPEVPAKIIAKLPKHPLLGSNPDDALRITLDRLGGRGLK